MDYPKFKVAKRSCRGRWTLLRTKYKRWMSEEIQATGIDAEVGELDEIIEDLIGKEDAAIDSDKEGKKKAEADKKAAEEIRIKAMERFGKTSKRGGEDGEEGAKKKKRRSGSDAVEFLREKAKLEHSLREEELQLRKDQQSQTLLILQQQQQMNQALLTLMEKILPKERNELFITITNLLLLANGVFLKGTLQREV